MRGITVSALLLVSVAATASAQGGQGMGGGMGPAMDDSTFRPTMPALTSLLQLTPDQVKKIAPLRDTLLASTRAERQEARSARAAMMQARQAGVSTDSLDVLRQKMRGIMMTMMPARMTFLSQMRPLLTPDQVKILDARQQEMMGAMRQQMQGNQPAGP